MRGPVKILPYFFLHFRYLPRKPIQFFPRYRRSCPQRRIDMVHEFIQPGKVGPQAFIANKGTHQPYHTGNLIRGDFKVAT
jgi:hypothetical protein